MNSNLIEFVVFSLIFIIPSSLLIFILLEISIKEKIAIFTLYLSVILSIFYLFSYR